MALRARGWAGRYLDRVLDGAERLCMRLHPVVKLGALRVQALEQARHLLELLEFSWRVRDLELMHDPMQDRNLLERIGVIGTGQFCS